MTIYYLIFISLTVFSFLEIFTDISKRTKKFIIILYSVVYVLMCTVYTGIMGDYSVYELFFNCVSARDLRMVFGGWFEYLYTVINYIVKTIFDSYIVLRFLLSSLVMSLWYKIYTYNESQMIGKYPLTIMLIIWTLNFGNVFISRSIISMAFLLYSLRYIEGRRPWRFVICVLIAGGFHTMSFLWIITYPIYHHIKSKVMMKFLIISVIVALVLKGFVNIMLIRIASFMPERAARSLNFYTSAGVDNMLGMQYSYSYTVIKAVANMLLLIILFMVLNSKIGIYDSTTRDKFDCYLKVYYTGAGIYVLALTVSVGLSRAAIPFTMISAFLMPHLFDLKILKINMGMRLLCHFIFVAYLFFRFYINLGNGVDAFETIF